MSLVLSPSVFCPCAQNKYLPYENPASLPAAQSDPQPAAEIASSGQQCPEVAFDSQLWSGQA